MKRLMMMVALAGGMAAFAQEQAPAEKPSAPKAQEQGQAAERPHRAREAHQRMMRRGGPGRARERGQMLPMGGMMRARAKDFGKLADGRETKVYRLQGVGGLILDISDYGGRLVRCYAPDRYGNLADVTLGWNTAAEYEKYGFSAGTLIGRYGNRIADGKFCPK